MITSKPNAYNQDIIVVKNSKSNVIKMIKHDSDLNASSKTGSVVGGPINGSISSYATSTDSFNYVPNNEFTGEDFFTFTMSDGVNTSDEKTVRITVIQIQVGKRNLGRLQLHLTYQILRVELL